MIFEILLFKNSRMIQNGKVSDEAIVDAFQATLASVRKKTETFRVPDILLELRRSLNDRTYKPDRYDCFVVRDPKIREIFAPSFRDRSDSILHSVIILKNKTPILANEGLSFSNGGEGQNCPPLRRWNGSPCSRNAIQGISRPEYSGPLGFNSANQNCNNKKQSPINWRLILLLHGGEGQN